MLNRVEGQIWIDRNSPNRLKYFVNNQEYEVSVAQNYEGQEGIDIGTVVALKPQSDGKYLLTRACFPEDIDYVIGVAGQSYNASEGIDHREMIPILRMDNLILKGEEIDNCFTDFELEEVMEIVESKNINLVGAPVYWFIGRTLPESNSIYEYKDSSNFTGRLTLCTPSGFQWKITDIQDDSLNIGYSNLLQIGTVASYKEENSVLTEIKINVNYSGFDSCLEWNWPLIKYKTIIKDESPVQIEVGLINPEIVEDRRNGDVTITIRHGLFPYNKEDKGKSKSQVYPRCFCDVVALNNKNKEGEQYPDTEYQVTAAIDNYYGLEENENPSNDRRTEVYMKTTESLRYSVSGKVIYKFNKVFN